MKKLTQSLLFLFFIAIIIEVVIIAPSSLDTPNVVIDAPPTEVEGRGVVEQVLTGMHLIESKEDEKEWELWSDEAKTYKKKKAWDLEKVKVKFFGANGVVFNVTGKSGTVEVKSKNLEIRGNVVTKTSNGYEFKTEVIRYNSKGRRLFSPNKIEMKGPVDAQKEQMLLTGVSLEANLDSALIEIKKDVIAEKPVASGKRAFIKSHRAQFSGRSNYARFLDDVVIDYESMRLTGPDATFNYDSKTDLINSLNVQGGVKVSDLDKWAISKMVNVDFDKEKYVFKGNPRVVQNNDELRGEEIIFYNGGKRVRIKKARANLDENSSGVFK